MQTSEIKQIKCLAQKVFPLSLLSSSSPSVSLPEHRQPEDSGPRFLSAECTLPFGWDFKDFPKQLETYSLPQEHVANSCFYF